MKAFSGISFVAALKANQADPSAQISDLGEGA